MAGTRGKWDHTFDLSFSVGWEAKVGAPRTADVEIKGKKQKMFLGVPTFHGHLRFADVSHLQDASEYDVEVLWGGDGPKEEEPSGQTKDLLRKLLLDRAAGDGDGDGGSDGVGGGGGGGDGDAGDGVCLPAFFKKRLAAFVEAYRAIDDPQAAIDELLQEGLGKEDQGQQREEEEQKAGGGENKTTKAGEADKTDKDDKAHKNDVQEGGVEKEQEQSEGSAAAAPPAEKEKEDEEFASRPAPASPWTWITMKELNAEPEERRDDPFTKAKNKGAAETETETETTTTTTTGEKSIQGDVTDLVESDSSGGAGGKNEPGQKRFNPLETPRMLNYFDKLQKEGYAVMVDGGMVDGGGGSDEAKDKKKKKKKKKETTKGSGESGAKSISEAVRDRVAAAMGRSDVVGGLQQQPGAPEKEKPLEQEENKKKKAPERVPVSAATKASLDYSRFEDIGDDDDSDQEAYTEELRSALGLGRGAGQEQEGPVYEIDEAQIPESLKSNELWNVVLGIAGGDVAKAMELIQDPEQQKKLQEHPEMLRLYGEEASGSGGSDDEDGSEEESSSSGSEEEEGI